MSVQQEKSQSPLTPSRVADFLNDHEDFFEQHGELLQNLKVPHPTGGAVSLIERQVEVLRDQNRALRKQIQELIGIARDNDRLYNNLHRMTCSLIAAVDLDEVIAILYAQLRDTFGADAVAIRLFAGRFPDRQAVEFLNHDEPGVDGFRGILRRGKPVCGRFNRDQLAFLFGERGDDIKSAAVVPLGDALNNLGFLLIASDDPGRFHAGMSTVFLSHLGETVSRVVGRYARTPAE